MSQKIKNAIIESATITIEDHGLLTIWLQLDYGGTGQGFGGYCLGKNASPEVNFKACKGNAAAAFIVGCLRAADVLRWDQLKGKSIRVRLDSDDWNASIEAIGHITKEDRWFAPKEVFER